MKVAVSFIDISGFSRISREMGDEYSAMLSHVFLSHCYRHLGTSIRKFMGDSVMAVFGSPEEAFRKVKAAMESMSMASIPVHASMAYGTVQTVSFRQLGEETVVGNTVNLAHRLLGIAGKGEIAMDRECSGFCPWNRRRVSYLKGLGKVEAFICGISAEKRRPKQGTIELPERFP